MTEQQQRIAIAEACGWQSITSFGKNVTGVLNQNPNSIREHIPNYPNDLNAMHEAENYRNDLLIKWEEYRHQLSILTSRKYGVPERASASQRAEAFLKTLDLWKDND